jgi:hypothetical protein
MSAARQQIDKTICERGEDASGEPAYGRSGHALHSQLKTLLDGARGHSDGYSVHHKSVPVACKNFWR